MTLYIIVGFLIAAASVVFALQNPGVTLLRFMSWSFSGSLALLILGAFAGGFIAALLFRAPSAIRRRWLISAQKRRIVELERQVNALMPPAERPVVPGRP